MKLFPFQLLTPTGTLFQGEVEMVVARGAEGEFGVLAGHAPLIAALKAGPLKIQAAGATRHFALHDGWLRTDGRRAEVLAWMALPADNRADAEIKTRSMQGDSGRRPAMSGGAS